MVKLPATSGSGNKQIIPPTYQADAALSQANPVQNTWYTILNTTLMVKCWSIIGYVATTGETIEVRATIDGQVLTGSQAAVAGTPYGWYKDPLSSALYTDTNYASQFVMCPFECKSLKVEIRKTTAAGAGNLNGRVTYSRW